MSLNTFETTLEQNSNLSLKEIQALVNHFGQPSTPVEETQFKTKK